MRTIKKVAQGRIQQLTGLFLIGLGLLVAAGWGFRNEAMVRIVPGSVSMGLNAACLFVAAGVGLVLLTTVHRTAFLFRFCAWLLILLPTVILIEHVVNIDLGVDWATLHASVKDGNPHPGRIAPNTALGFLFAGLVFVLLGPASTRQWARRLITICAYATLAIGVAGLLGYVLKLEAMYRIAAYNGMAAPSAVGMTALGFGLRMLLHSPTANQPRQRADRHITNTATVMLTVLALTAGVMGFAVLQEGFRASMADSARLTAKNTAVTIVNTLAQRMQLAEVVTTRPALQKHLATLDRDPGDREALTLAREVGNSFAALGVSGMRFFNARGDVLLTTGALIEPRAAVSMPLKPSAPVKSSTQAALLWRDGFVLRTKNNIVNAGKTIATVTVEQQLPALTSLLADIQGIGQSSDVLLCGREDAMALCFPTRFYRANIRIPMLAPDGQPNLPISRALLGESGAQIVKDLRGVDVLEGYAPLAELGLGLVIKIDTDELYAPMRQRLHHLIALLIALAAAGGLALRMKIQPLAQRILADQRRMQVILDSSHEAFVAIDQDGTITDWNPEAEQTFGWSRQDAIGQELATLIVPANKRAAHHHGIARFLKTGHGPVLNKRVELIALHRSGREFPVEITISPIKTADGFVFTAFMHDISARKDTELKLHRQATCDLLTGLPNRAELMSRLQQAMDRANRSKKPLALMFLDIDGFKKINDGCGHEAGDNLLKEFARCLQTCVRKTDTVARLAGDEFIIVAENVVNGAQDAETIANKIVASLATPLDCGHGQHIAVTASIGIAVYATGKESRDDLLSRADKAMYLAKQSGKNRFSVAG